MRNSKIRLKKLIKDKTDKLFWFRTDPEAKKTEIHKKSDQTPVRIPDRKVTDFRKTIIVLNVPRTPNGTLARLVSKAEQNFRLVCTTKVNIAERVGTTIKSLLVKSNP